jgi:hypothetical protein
MSAAMHAGLALSQMRDRPLPEPDPKETLGLKMWDLYDLLHTPDIPDEDNLPLKYVFAIILQIIIRCKSGYAPCDYKSKILSRLDCIKRVVEGLRNAVNSSIVSGSKYQYEAQALHESTPSSINSSLISASLTINCKEWWPSKIFIDPDRKIEYQYTNVKNILNTYAPRGEFLPKPDNPDEDDTIPIADISKNATESPTSVVEGPYGFLEEPEASIVPMPTILAQNITISEGGKGRKSKRNFLKGHYSIKKSKKRSNKRSNKRNKKGKTSRKSKNSRKGKNNKRKP